jgi:hypothetical protein
MIPLATDTAHARWVEMRALDLGGDALDNANADLRILHIGESRDSECSLREPRNDNV